MREIDRTAYAAGLARRGSVVLEAGHLHAWMIQRLMLDLGLEHASAAGVTDAVLAHERSLASAREAHRSHLHLTAPHLHRHGRAPAV